MAAIQEKTDDYGHLERKVSEDSGENQAAIDALTPEEQKKLIRRIDIRLVVTLGLMYAVSLMDRTNLGIAAIAGMSFGRLISRRDGE